MPQAPGLVPGWQVSSSWQQPAQLCSVQTQKPFELHSWPVAQEPQLPPQPSEPHTLPAPSGVHTHCPCALHAPGGGQLTHCWPFVPHVFAGLVRQTPGLFGPLAQQPEQTCAAQVCS